MIGNNYLATDRDACRMLEAVKLASSNRPQSEVFASFTAGAHSRRRRRRRHPDRCDCQQPRRLRPARHPPYRWAARGTVGSVEVDSVGAVTIRVGLRATPRSSLRSPPLSPTSPRSWSPNASTSRRTPADRPHAGCGNTAGRPGGHGVDRSTRRRNERDRRDVEEHARHLRPRPIRRIDSHEGAGGGWVAAHRTILRAVSADAKAHPAPAWSGVWSVEPEGHPPRQFALAGSVLVGDDLVQLVCVSTLMAAGLGMSSAHAPPLAGVHRR